MGIGEGGSRFRDDERGWGEYLTCVELDAIGSRSEISASVTSGLTHFVAILSRCRSV